MVKRVHIAPHRTAQLSIIRASASLFDLLKIPSSALKARQDTQQVPGLILSEAAWREYFDSDPAIAGRMVEIAGRPVRITGVLSQDQWRLPGRADGWMVADQSQMDSLSPNSKGFVLAHMRPSGFPSGSSGRHWMTVYRANGESDSFECVSLAEQTRQPFSIYLFTLFIACLALPATTPLPLGEYPARAERLGWGVRVRRWLFLVAKLALILPLVYFASIDLAYGNIASRRLHSVGPISVAVSSAGQLVLGPAVCVSLGVARPARPLPGMPAAAHQPGPGRRSVTQLPGLERHRADLRRRHGLLHIPEIPTSWFSTSDGCISIRRGAACFQMLM